MAAGPLRVAGNLPYNISSPILFKLLETSRTSPGLQDATVMLQLEVAERLVAAPGTKDYGVLTIFTSAQADVQRLLTLPPGAFRPAPKVQSAVVRLTFKPSPLPAGARGGVRRRWSDDVHAAAEDAAERPPPVRRDSVGRDSKAILTEAGIDPVRRPETLTQEDLLRLVSVFSHEP